MPDAIARPRPTGKRMSGPAVRRVRLLALLLAAGAVVLLAGGIRLAMLGGSPYYMAAGALLAATAAGLWRARRWALFAYGGLLGITILWTLYESGLEPWAMLSRLGLFYAVALFVFAPFVRRSLGPSALPKSVQTGLWTALLVAALGVPGAAVLGAIGYSPARPKAELSAAGPTSDDWDHWGGTAAGEKFTGLGDITPANVSRLERAWTFSFGEDKPYSLQVTPLKVGDTLYVCNSENIVVALDPESGKPRWRFDPQARIDNAPFRACRGVAYHAMAGESGHCARRIYTTTVDARLIAIDAGDGRRCAAFGMNGEISLFEGLGEVRKGYYFHGAAPTIARGRIVVGGIVADGQTWDAPSGVIRAFDARTGRLAWAYDVGRPDRTGAPPPGEVYTRSTPNSWGQMAYDDGLGLVYVPTGNATPDYYGAQRRTFDDEISSAVMALDIETGRRRWLFQTVHHDLWDYDVGSQPVLIDLPSATGTVRALLQPTKRGEVFLLDRVTGRPMADVVERRVPSNGAAAGERLSPTQPFATDMPSLGGGMLSESRMWGLTPFDQLWCRIRFKEARYEGPFTPPGVSPSIMYPGYNGGMNWGSVSVDPQRRVMVAVTNHVANHVRLFPRAEADAKGAFALGHGREGMDAFTGIHAQRGTPFASLSKAFLSPLGVPCQQPPWGRISAIDLDSRRLIWSRPLGTAAENGPWGIPTRLPLVIGTPVIGGALLTRTGLVFVGASTDKHLRAFDSRTGELLWQARLPHAGNAIPISYRGSHGGRQYIVIAAAGHRALPDAAGDTLIAFALPVSAADAKRR